jgi:hypothetical protein
VNRPPPPVTNLHVVARPVRAGQITIAWNLPAAHDLAQIIVRRAPAHQCPKTISSGTQVGGKGIRTRQTDKSASNAAGYCYSVFALDTASHASSPAAKSIAPPDLTPPGAPTGVTASGTAGHVVVAWTAAGGNPADYIVRRSASGHCPPEATRATPIDVVGAGTTSVTDTSADAGRTYCYAVFAVDKAGNVSTAAGDSQLLRLSTPTRTAPTTPKPPPTQPAHSQSSSPVVPAELARLVAAIAVAVIVFGVIVLGGIRILQNPRRRQQWTYDNRTTPGAPRITIERYDARALVIPTVIVVLGVICIIALAGVLL